MYQKIENGSIVASILKLRYKQEEDVEYFKADFPRAKWVFFENDFYDEDVEQFNNGDTEHYKTFTSIPKYAVLREYYIYDVDDEYIIEDGARLIFYQ